MKKKRKLDADPSTDEWRSYYMPTAALQCRLNTEDDKVKFGTYLFEVKYHLK